MTIPDNAIRGPGYYAQKVGNEYAVTFDPGAHTPQVVTVFLSSGDFEIIRNDPSRFNEIVVPAMNEQKVVVK